MNETDIEFAGLVIGFVGGAFFGLMLGALLFIK